ncbi:imidazolonepropionase-like amidohydrolase [Bradyrhizobium sp. GM5.1]
MCGPAEILIEDDAISEVSDSVGRPGGANVIGLGDRTVSPGLGDMPRPPAMLGPRSSEREEDGSVPRVASGLGRVFESASYVA